MRFTGQIKLPDLDYPGLPAVVEVDGNQTELFVEGESLGRWSLVDVRAERLISNAFTLDLRGEEVTFLADQPTEFAYSGVDHMANVWARHKAIRLPLRGIANGKSRRGTKPSRIADLREAIEEALSGTGLNAFSGRVEEARPVHKPAALGGSGGVTSPGRTRLPAGPPVIVDRTPGGSRFRPADHAVGRYADQPVPEEVEDFAGTTEPADSIYRQSVPWATEPQAASSVPVEEEAPSSEATGDTAAPVEDPEPRPRPTADSPASAEPYVPWIAPPSPDPATARVSAPEHEPALVVDLDALDGTATARTATERTATERTATARTATEKGNAPSEPQEVAASGAETGRAGIMGAVRSAFVRTKTEHEHEYVEAPGGLGIKRQICADCGHISIGVAE